MSDTRPKQLRDRYQCQFYAKLAEDFNIELSCTEIANIIDRPPNFVRKWSKTTGVVEDKHRIKKKFACLTAGMKRLIIRRSTNKRTVGKHNSSCRSIKMAILQSYKVDISHQTINAFRLSEGFKCYKIRDCPLIPREAVKARRRFAKNHIKLKKYYFRRILFTDEKLWGLNKVINHGQEYFWTKDKRRVPRNPHPRQYKKYMLHCGITSKGILTPHWVPAGKTMDTKIYLSFLEDYVKEIPKRTRPSSDMTKTQLFTQSNAKKWIYWQDGASSHTSKATQKWLLENVPEYYAKGQVPAHSPDISFPIETFWAILQSKVYENGGFKTLEKLKARVDKCCREFPQETLQNLVDSMPARMKKLAKNPSKTIN